MTAETSNARGDVVAWFPTNGRGEIIRTYGDGSPVYACRTKEEAEQAKRCHLGATGPVIPLYAAPPPAAARGDVRYDRELIAQMLDAAEAPAFTMEEMDAQARLLREAAQAKPEARGVVDAKPVGTITRRDSGDEVIEHQIALDPGFEESLYRYPAGTVIHLYAEAAADVALAHVQAAAAALAQQPAATAAKDAEIEALRAEVERSERYAEQSERERLWAEARAERLAEALRNSSDALERLAFAIRAPNAHTPQLVELAIAMRAAALEAFRDGTTSPVTSPVRILIDAIESEIRQLEGTAAWKSQAARIASLRAAIDAVRENNDA